MSLYVKPKSKLDVEFKYLVNQKTNLVFHEYSSYTGYSIDELLMIIADKLLDDPKFIEYFSNKRANKKIMSVYEQHKYNMNDFDFEGFETIDIDDKDIPFK